MTMFPDPFRGLDRLTEAMFGRSGMAAMPVDLFREGDHYVLNADLPGVEPGAVDVSVDGQTLTIRAERRVALPEGAEWLTRERPEVTLVRQFSVGEGVDADAITANYDNGVLSLVIPVSERAKPRKVQISGAAAKPIEARQSKSAEQGDAEPVGSDREASSA